MNLKPQDVDVMDNIIFSFIMDYYKLLQKRGYSSNADVSKLLVLCFYWNFVTNDYRGLISREDYHYIERALNCLFGTSCLISYVDYLKMGKLHLGAITEVAQRMRNIENTPVLKLIHDGMVADPESDVLIVEKEGNGQLIIG